ncbi:hypothetical protein [Enterobacter chuandaensis]|uniref:Glycosyl transferase n=1 Tax=Enterobacter chuandaensis TaxID=2497875 RepID=A0AA96LZ94_9ENTR|nr:hypothetical protein [Enterobacter chuandaensis]MCW4782450.1 hypothetical protein [Enterobacter chuandaensis]MDA4761808.1 hypothetical protein [Enterobacter chuandaensis]WNS36497.1 hypothetical protein RQP59_15575 [Enterobacter chuandaensis]
MKNIAFTIVAQNYLGYALTLYKSMSESNSNIDFRIYIADGLDEIVKDKITAEYAVELVDALTISPDLFLKMGFYYDVTEYCTSIKPFVINSLFNEGYDKVCYIDPDIYVYKNLSEPVLNYLDNYSIFLTPHICSPITDDKIPNEQIHLFSGTYNLGFLAVKNDEVSNDFIEWWMNKCKDECFFDPVKGLFVDQKWINLVPGLFPNVYISRHLGLNVSYWNLHERVIINNKIKNDDLIFYHFSGIDVNNVEKISKYQNRYSLSERQDIKKLFLDYAALVKMNLSTVGDLPAYKFFKYKNEMVISLLARRIYFAFQNDFSNPLESIEKSEIFIAFLKSKGIYEKKSSNEIRDKNVANDKIEKLNYIIKLLIRIIGPYRYQSLVKAFRYLGSLSSIQQIYK